MRNSTNDRHEETSQKLKAMEQGYDMINDKMEQIDAMKQSLTLSVTDRNRLDELTDFYRHLNGVIDTIIDKFSENERTMNRFIKQ